MPPPPPPPPPLPDSLLPPPPPPPFLLSRSSAFFFFDLLDFFSLFLFEMAPLDVEEDEEPAGEDTEECFTLRVRLVAEADDEDALEVVEAGDPGREVDDAAKLGGRAVAAVEFTGAIAVVGAGCSVMSIFDSDESRSGNFRA